MPGLKRHTAAGWTNGQTVTAGVDNGSGSPLDLVATASGGTATATDAYGGARGVELKTTGTAGAVASIGFGSGVGAALDSTAEALDLWLPAGTVPSAELRFLNAYLSDGTSSAPRFAWLATNRLRLRSATGSLDLGTTPDGMDLRGMWLHIQKWQKKGTTESDGSVQGRVTRRDTGAVVLDVTWAANTSAGVQGYASSQAGRPSAVTWAGSIIVRNFTFEPNATGLIEATPTNPQVFAGRGGAWVEAEPYAGRGGLWVPVS